LVRESDALLSVTPTESSGTGQATLEVIGSMRSYALKWCKPNNDDDDDDDARLLSQCHG